MRQLTQIEIGRTAFREHDLPEDRVSTVDSNNICPYCKNQETDIVYNALDLAPFKQFYGDKPFRVMECFSCSAVFSICLKN
jgi:hypothetical protein